MGVTFDIVYLFTSLSCTVDRTLSKVSVDTERGLPRDLVLMSSWLRRRAAVGLMCGRWWETGRETARQSAFVRLHGVPRKVMFPWWWVRVTQERGLQFVALAKV